MRPRLTAELIGTGGMGRLSSSCHSGHMVFGSRRRKTDRLIRKVDRLEQKRDAGGLAKLLGHDDVLVYSRARKALKRVAGDSTIDPLLHVLDAEADAALRDVLDPDGALRAALEADERTGRATSDVRGDDDAAVSNLRLIIHDPGYAVIPNGATFRDMRARRALQALEDIVAQRGDGVPRWVLYAGATLDDFVVWAEIDDGEPVGLRTSAADLRRLCLSVLLRPE